VTREHHSSDLERARAICRRVRLASGRPDGRCGKVAKAIAADLGWAYRWGHLRLLDGGFCWIHCWNQLADGTVVDTTADQFEERWLGGVAVLQPGDPLHANYRPVLSSGCAATARGTFTVPNGQLGSRSRSRPGRQASVGCQSPSKRCQSVR